MKGILLLSSSVKAGMATSESGRLIPFCGFINGFLVETVALAVYFSFGVIAQESSYRQGFVVFGLVVTVVGLFYFFQRYKKMS